MENGKKIPMLISLGITTVVLVITMICFFNLEQLTPATQNVFGYGILLVLTLCKPVLIAYVVLGGLYAAFGIMFCFGIAQKGGVKFLLFLTAALAPLILVTQVPLWGIAIYSNVLIVFTLLSEIAFFVNFGFLRRAYYSLYPKKK